VRAVPNAPRLPRAARALSGLAAFAIAVSAVASARADPCKAIPDRGPTPATLAPGRAFTGPVVYVGDGDSLCVALGPGPAHWAEVRLADVYAPELAEPQGREAKAILEQTVMGRRIDCVAGRRSYDRIVAACRMGGRAVSARLQAAGGPVGGRGRPNR
jgi:endonuclease YncB( thermonuclease family)